MINLEKEYVVGAWEDKFHWHRYLPCRPNFSPSIFVYQANLKAVMPSAAMVGNALQ
jgi:hypothetical protein